MNFNKAAFKASYGLLKQIPKSSLPEIAFSGRSNVGKSSLINKVLNRKALARVSSVPGKTATVNFYEVDGVYFADLPGYGYAKVARTEKQRWDDLVGGYLSGDRNIQLVFQLVDFRHPPTANDISMINYLIDSGVPFVIVLTKADKLSKRERAARREALNNEIPCAEDIHMIEFSAVTGEGAEEIREIVTDIQQEYLNGEQ